MLLIYPIFLSSTKKGWGAYSYKKNRFDHLTKIISEKSDMELRRFNFYNISRIQFLFSMK